MLTTGPSMKAILEPRIVAASTQGAFFRGQGSPARVARAAASSHGWWKTPDTLVSLSARPHAPAWRDDVAVSRHSRPRQEGRSPRRAISFRPHCPESESRGESACQSIEGLCLPSLRAKRSAADELEKRVTKLPDRLSRRQPSRLLRESLHLISRAPGSQTGKGEDRQYGRQRAVLFDV